MAPEFETGAGAQRALSDERSGAYVRSAARLGVLMNDLNMDEHGETWENHLWEAARQLRRRDHDEAAHEHQRCFENHHRMPKYEEDAGSSLTLTTRIPEKAPMTPGNRRRRNVF